uniref:Uncharacterized protein n=1 Tax=Oryza brachyantha TaxID=4533 RepID=J3MDL6_ORYBR
MVEGTVVDLVAAMVGMYLVMAGMEADMVVTLSTVVGMDMVEVLGMLVSMGDTVVVVVVVVVEEEDGGGDRDGGSGDDDGGGGGGGG